MKEEHEEILELLRRFLTKYPEQRFTQALANLDINQHIDLQDAEDFGIPILAITDNWNDKDSWVLSRMMNKLEEFEIT